MGGEGTEIGMKYMNVLKIKKKQFFELGGGGRDFHIISGSGSLHLFPCSARGSLSGDDWVTD